MAGTMDVVMCGAFKDAAGNGKFECMMPAHA